MRSLSDAQLKRLETAAKTNDPVLYYELLSEYGFGYGKLGLEVATNTGVYGRIANSYLKNKMAELGMKYSADLRNRLVSRLMQADVLYRRSEDIVTVENIATYHRQVFRDLNIPLSAWTGAFLDDRGAQALFCPTCTEGELAGHSRLDGVREIWGDVIDDLTDEAFDLGSGPSEGAAKGAAEFMEELFFDAGPRALDDELSDDIRSLFGRTINRPSPSTASPQSIFHDSSFRPGSAGQPTISARAGTGEHVVEMSIAPGQTRTATINLPGLTLEIAVTMPD